MEKACPRLLDWVPTRFGMLCQIISQNNPMGKNIVITMKYCIYSVWAITFGHNKTIECNGQAKEDATRRRNTKEIMETALLLRKKLGGKGYGRCTYAVHLLHISCSSRYSSSPMTYMCIPQLC